MLAAPLKAGIVLKEIKSHESHGVLRPQRMAMKYKEKESS